jgi:hypothetical protein
MWHRTDSNLFSAGTEPRRDVHSAAIDVLRRNHLPANGLRPKHFSTFDGQAFDYVITPYEARASFRAWMYRIVTNTCLDMLKARSRRVLAQDVGPSGAPAHPRPRRAPTSYGSSRIAMRCCRRCPIPSTLCGCARRLRAPGSPRTDGGYLS